MSQYLACLHAAQHAGLEMLALGKEEVTFSQPGLF